MSAVVDELGLVVLERGWLSSNNVVFIEGDSGTVVDTGYHSHASQTVELVRRALGGRPLARIVNTHLHSDHCGGNAALQRTWPCAAKVPEASFAAARDWDQGRLSYRTTGQSCERFAVDGFLAPGEAIRLGGFEWQIFAAPGHDPDAVMLFEPRHRVLISGDALWERNLAIAFPEIDNGAGFEGMDEVLDTIARLSPRIVIPGHGRPFDGVGQALRASRERLQQFRREPRRHLEYAMRALVMFHMLEVRNRARDELVAWILRTPIMARIHLAISDGRTAAALADSAVERLLVDGSLRRERDRILLGR